MRYRSALAAVALACVAGPSRAQTVLAPSGDSAVTQPGGTEGRAARRNLREAIRDGDVVGAPRAHPHRPGDPRAPRDAAPLRAVR